MTGLDIWLKRATRCLSDDAVAQVRAEIGEHFESAREAAMARGAPPDEAERLALAALGDAGNANMQYRRVLLTRSEAKLLAQGNREAQFFCSHFRLRVLSSALSIVPLWLALALYRHGLSALGSVVLAAGLGMGFMLAGPLFPVYTPSRSHIFRAVKCAVHVGAIILAFGPNALRMSWLIAICLWSFFQAEWMRASIRRKLPVARWPRQLYL